MDLGAFSISLSVKDIKASKDFYLKLGFEIFGGDEEQLWLVLKNGNHVIGLFQDMFDSNILTFNPGWDQSANRLDPFFDIREIHRELKNRGIKVDGDISEKSSGPASFSLTDPDGNVILIDQHV